MVTLMFIIGVVLVGISARLIARAVVVPRMQIKAHLREISEYGFEPPELDEAMSLGQALRRARQRVALGIGHYLITRFPMIASIQKNELTAAGYYELDPELLHGYRAMAGVGLPLSIYLLLALGGGKLSMLDVLLLVVSAVAGWQLPAFTIRKRGSKRLDEVDRILPEAIDLLIATVEAGMGFSASLHLLAERLQGALGDELRLTMRQQSLGMSMGHALEGMAERCDTPSMKAFVRTAGRGESLGVSIGPVLRELSSDQRRRRRQAAREKMQKAPVKMIFPLMFLIFPALMIVLMYPAAYSVSQNLSHL